MSNHICSDRPLPARKTIIVIAATILTLFKANTKEGTKEVARLAADTTTFCILALNKVSIIAITTILVLHVGNGRSEHVIGHHVPRHSVSHRKHSPQYTFCNNTQEYNELSHLR